jgi:hypothetical protein
MLITPSLHLKNAKFIPLLMLIAAVIDVFRITAQGQQKKSPCPPLQRGNDYRRQALFL